MKDQLRWGVIGPGTIAHKFVDGVRHAPNARLEATASRSPERAEAFAKEHDIPHAFGSYEKLAQSDTVDAIYVSSPHNYHLEHALLCMDHGKAVLCEKPIGVNEVQARKMAERAKEKKVFLMEAMWTRFLPAIRKAKQIIRDGALGDIQFISASFCYNLGKNENPKSRNLNPDLAGGSLLDVGIYPISLAQYFLEANPESIVSSMRKATTGVDWRTSMLAEYANGTSAAFFAGMNIPSMTNASVIGDHGRIDIPKFFMAKEFTLYSKGETVTFELPYESDGFAAEIEAASADILEGKLENELMPHADMIDNMAVMDQIRAQHDLKYPDE